MSARTLTGIRPSLWARCATAAVYQGRGEIEAEPPAEAQEWFARGHLFEQYVVRQIVAKHGADNVERQVVIPIPGVGEGHADAYVRTHRALVEVKSTVSPYPNSDIFGHGVNQLRLYLAHHWEARVGWLYMINPNRLTPADVYEVRLTDADRAEIEQQRVYVERGKDGGEIDLEEHGSPLRPCTRPGQARGRMCPFAHVCFDGWEPDVETETVTDPRTVDAAQRLFAIKREKASHSAAIKALEENEKEAQAELAEAVEREALVGPYVVRRTHVERQPTFQPKAFEAAGHSLEALAGFFKPGSEYDVWRVEMADESGEVGFGEAPF